ncbi:hypothetical protein MMC09_001436 [Bachmanniomyces sp. S44760]|nr:hypothetical protein [Bachmanniomyces sp. S44760]
MRFFLLIPVLCHVVGAVSQMITTTTLTTLSTFTTSIITTTTEATTVVSYSDITVTTVSTYTTTYSTTIPTTLVQPTTVTQTTDEGYIVVVVTSDPTTTFFPPTPSSSPSSSGSSSLSSSTSTGPVTVQTVGPYNYIGCYTELQNGRALSGPSNGNVTSVEDCEAFCVSQGSFSYFSVEYSSQCYCGDSLDSDSQLAQTPGPLCTYVCTYTPGEICGGSGVFNLYYAADPPVQSSLPAPGSSTSSSASSSSTTPTGPQTVETVGPYSYVGCYTEVQNGRALDGAQNQNVTGVEECELFCSGGSYNYFGLEYFTQCYCGNSIQAPSRQVTDGDNQCITACTYSPDEFCGGYGVLDIYALPVVSSSSSISSSTFASSSSLSLPPISSSSSISSSFTSSSSSTPTGPQIVQTASPYVGVGCYTELQNGRALDGASDQSVVSVEECAAYCVANALHFPPRPRALGLYKLLALLPTKGAITNLLLTEL